MGSERGSDGALDRSAVDALRALDDGDGAFLTEVIASFLRDARRLAEEIARAAEGLDSGALDRSAHTLKSSSATVGALRLSELCARLEQCGRRGDPGAGAAALPEMWEALGAAEDALRAEVRRPGSGPG